MIKNFYEVITAPEFEKGALELLREKKNLSVIKVKKGLKNVEKKSFFGGMLLQDVNTKKSSVKT